MNGHNVLIDPFITPHTDPQFKRTQDCPVKVDELKNISHILITQEQHDHFDKKTIEEIALRDSSTVLGHQSVLSDLNLPLRFLKPISYATGQCMHVKGLDIEVVSAHHPRAFYPVGYKISHNGKTLYHAGDTDLLDYENFSADVALLPIGGSITMDVVDAIKATKCIKPEVVIPMHYNTFSFIQANPDEFAQKIKKSTLKTLPVILKPTESFKFE